MYSKKQTENLLTDQKKKKITHSEIRKKFRLKSYYH